MPGKATRIERVQTPAVKGPGRPPTVPRHAEPPVYQGDGRGGLLPGQTRRDQRQCPSCHVWGCPVTGGTRLRSEGVYRYRTCLKCSYVFATVTPHGGGREQIVA